MRGKAVGFDYDDNPGRFWAWTPDADVHASVADRLTEEQRAPILDVGCGYGRLAAALPESSPWIGCDRSNTQLRRAPRPVALGDATSLPFRSDSLGAVAALWMLYHLADPTRALVEARRVLRHGGWFVASTARRDDSPELLPAAEPTPFDAEEAPAVVAEVFGRVEVVVWDGPFVTLRDRDEVERYLISHLADPARADQVTTPLTLTKRGCLVWARK